MSTECAKLAHESRHQWSEGTPRSAVIGRPNAGKSSLLNQLLGRDRAIVSAIPGTTRDTIEETANIRGVPVVFIDTAGLRKTRRVNDSVERAVIRLRLSRRGRPRTPNPDGAI